MLLHQISSSSQEIQGLESKINYVMRKQPDKWGQFHQIGLVVGQEMIEDRSKTK